MSTTILDSLTDPDSLQSQPEIPYHTDTETVDAETFETLSELEDMAIAGVRNDGGEVLFRRLTPDCAWKLPVVTVGDNDDYADGARRAAAEVGVPVELDAVVGVWRVEARLADGDRTATRTFVVFEATPTGGADLSAARDREGRPADVGWFDELPDGAQKLPGTDRVLS